MPACKLCGRDATKWLMLAHTTVWRCSNADCQLQFCDPQLGDAALSVAYSRLYYPDPHDGAQPVYESTPELVLHQVIRNITELRPNGSGRRFLDFGCGAGNLCAVAREFGWVPVGIEADPEGRESAVKNGRIEAYANVDELLKNNPHPQFQLITLWQVIEHLRVPWFDLKRLGPLLAPDGIIVVSTPNAEGLKARVLRGRWDNYQNLTHFYYFTPRSIAAVFREAGFSRFQRWNFDLRYEHHRGPRRLLQKALSAFALNGELLYGISA